MIYFGMREGKARSDQLIGVYEYLANKRKLFLHGPICSMTARADMYSSAVVGDAIIALGEASDEPIWLTIHSPGGYVDDGYALYDAIKLSKAPVYTVGRTCHSMAAVILSAGESRHRYVFPHSEIMLHLPVASIEGTSADVAVRNTQLQKTKEKLVASLIENGATKTARQILRDIDREKWLTAQEAVDYGIVDKILTEKGIFA